MSVIILHFLHQYFIKVPLFPSHCGGISSPGDSCPLQHVGSSHTRDQTCVPCIGRQILNHWNTREVLALLLTSYMCISLPL